MPPFRGALQAADSDDSSERDVPTRRQRAGTDNFQKLGRRTRQDGDKGKEPLYSDDDSSDSDRLVLGHERDEEYGHAFGQFAEDHVSQPSPYKSELSSAPFATESDKGITILYIQMQYCEGQTLLEFLQQHPPAPNKHDPKYKLTEREHETERAKWKIFRQVLQAVNYLHTSGILHRDIKPENVFLDNDNDARLGDFGLAIRYNPAQHQSGTPHGLGGPPDGRLPKALSGVRGGLTTGVGTLRFAAPEQIKAGKKRAAYGYKVDVYSLGVVLLDLFRDHDISFQELNELHTATVQGKVEAGLAKQMRDKRTVALIERMIAMDPDERPSVLEVLTR